MLQSLKKYLHSQKRIVMEKKKELSRKLNVGFIGCGKHASETLYPLFQYVPVQLQAVCALHEVTAKKNAKLFGAKKYYLNYHEMINTEKLDAVFIATNRKSHKTIIRDCLEKGLHVFVEKPPAETGEECIELAHVASRQKKKCIVGFQKRFAPCYEKTRQLICSSSFEKPVTISLQALCGPCSSEEEFLYEIGIHYFDLLRFFGGDIEKINIEKNCNSQYTYLCTILFRNNIKGQLLLSSSSSWNYPSERLLIFNNTRQIVVDNMVKIEWHKKTKTEPGIISAEGGKQVWEPNWTIPSYKNQSLFLTGYGYEIIEFVNSIKKEKKSENSISESQQNLAIIQYILKNKEQHIICRL